MTSSKDLLAPFRAKGQSAPAPQPTTVKTPYRAYEESKDEKRYLEIRVKSPRPSKSPRNIDLTGVICEWRMGLIVHLEYFGKMTVEIEGERLTQLAKAIREWKVEWLAEFDPEMHAPSTDPDAPVINSITILTTRPEEPPPANQRH